jgi:surfeit locus 1 family protein
VKVNLRNDHLGYALTWFGLAAVLAVIFVLWAWKELRRDSV